MKNKKTRNSLVALVVASIIFSISAVSVMANSSGYDKYKKATLDLIKNKNYTLELKNSIIYNGKIVESDNFEYQKDGKVSLETTSYDGIDMTYGNYYDEDCSISLENNIPTYYSSYGGHSFLYELENLTPAQEKFINVLLDSFLGDTKNHFVIDNNNISLKLSEEQLPPIVNASLSLMLEETDSYFSSYEPDNSDYFLSVLLSDNPGIKSFEFNSSLDDKGQISDFNFSTELGSYDKNNTYQSLVFNFTGKISNYNSTVIIKPEVSQELIDNNYNFYDDDYYQDEDIYENGVQIENIYIESNPDLQKAS